MDDEAQSPLSQKDPTFGRIREPVIKWLTLMRSMDFKRNEQNIHSMSLVNMNLGTLGQNPYSAPSVFSWFDYDCILESSVIIHHWSSLADQRCVECIILQLQPFSL